MSDAELAPREARHDAHIPLHKLFEPVKVRRYNLRQRVVIAALTRSRANLPGNIPSQVRHLIVHATRSGPAQHQRSGAADHSKTGLRLDT